MTDDEDTNAKYDAAFARQVKEMGEIAADWDDELFTTKVVELLILDKGLINAWQRTIKTALLIFRIAERIRAVRKAKEDSSELHERTAFEGWARSQWTNHQSIPDNAWKGWLARAQQPQAVIMVNGAAYTPKQISNAIAMATCDGFRPQDLPSE